MANSTYEPPREDFSCGSWHPSWIEQLVQFLCKDYKFQKRRYQFHRSQKDVPGLFFVIQSTWTCVQISSTTPAKFGDNICTHLDKEKERQKQKRKSDTHENTCDKKPAH